MQLDVHLHSNDIVQITNGLKPQRGKLVASGFISIDCVIGSVTLDLDEEMTTAIIAMLEKNIKKIRSRKKENNAKAISNRR